MTRGIKGLIAFPRSLEFERFGIRVHFTLPPWCLTFALCAASPAVLTFEEMFESIWGDPVDGGPDSARGIIYNDLDKHIRPKMRRLGVCVDTRWGIGRAAIDISGTEEVAA
jgi:hypothetical protein